MIFNIFKKKPRLYESGDPCPFCLNNESVGMRAYQDGKKAMFFCSDCNEKIEDVRPSECLTCGTDEHTRIITSPNNQYVYPYCTLHPEEDEKEKMNAIMNNEMYDK
jgi:hypothetical protein